MSAVQREARRRFVQIHPSVFSHPLDAAALKTLATFKGMDYICKKVLEYGLERIMFIQNVGNRVLVGPGQIPELHDMMRTACTTLDLPLVDLYVEMNPLPNAYTTGVARPFIVATTGLLDLFTDEEILAVLGHELGHVLCRHVLYGTIAKNISAITAYIGDVTLGVGKILSTGLVIALLEWARKSEFTADRAGLLVSQDVDVMVSVMMKLAGGSGRFTQRMNRKAFLRQADKYDSLDDSNLNRAYKLLQEVNLSHPIPVLRAKEINLWSQSEEYRQVLAGNYQKRPHCGPLCGYCSGKVDEADDFCSGCGAPVAGTRPPRKTAAPRPSNCTSCLAAVPPEYEECPVCGAGF